MNELWNWQRCKNRIRGLNGRLGFSENSVLRFLSLRLSLKDGSIYDELNNFVLSKNYNYLPNIYCILYSYSGAEEWEETGNLVTSKQLQGGQYCNIMVNRATSLIVDLFKNDAKYLVQCANLLGGKEIDFSYGDYSVKINPLPLIPITIVMYEKDIEFSASSQIFFDESIKNYLDLEQAGMLSEFVANRMKNAYQYLTNNSIH